jgi:uncharacterized membrane protein YdjX (TVP38/TMEM64 family)
MAHRLRPLLGTLAVVCFIGLGLWGISSETGRSIARVFLEGVEAMGIWGPLVLLAAYGLIAVFLLPFTMLLHLGVGFVFGMAAGAPLALGGVMLGAVLTYVVSSLALKDVGRALMAREPRLEWILQAVSQAGLRLQILVRASPIVPQSWVNYVIPLTRIPWWKNALAAGIGQSPLVLLDLYIGSLARSLSEAMVGGQGITGLKIGVLVVGGLVTVAAGVWTTRIARRALVAHAPAGTPTVQ